MLANLGSIAEQGCSSVLGMYIGTYYKDHAGYVFIDTETGEVLNDIDLGNNGNLGQDRFQQNSSGECYHFDKDEQNVKKYSDVTLKKLIWSCHIDIAISGNQIWISDEVEGYINVMHPYYNRAMCEYVTKIDAKTGEKVATAYALGRRMDSLTLLSNEIFIANDLTYGEIFQWSDSTLNHIAVNVNDRAFWNAGLPVRCSNKGIWMFSKDYLYITEVNKAEISVLNSISLKVDRMCTDRGSLDGFGVFTMVSDGTTLNLARVSSNTTVLWETSVQCPFYPREIYSDFDSNVYVTLHTTPTTIIKFGSDGTFLWEIILPVPYKGTAQFIGITKE